METETEGMENELVASSKKSYLDINLYAYYMVASCSEKM